MPSKVDACGAQRRRRSGEVSASGPVAPLRALDAVSATGVAERCRKATQRRSEGLWGGFRSRGDRWCPRAAVGAVDLEGQIDRRLTPRRAFGLRPLRTLNLRFAHRSGL